jgi:TonB dependent receptor/Carboxypeptidase regulatory-like domain
MQYRLTAVALVCLLRLEAHPGEVIRGVVTDESSGNAIPNAQLMLVGATHPAACNSRGEFELTSLGVGPHLLQVSAPGYRVLTVRLEASASRGHRIAVSLIPSRYARVDKVSVNVSEELRPRNRDQEALALSATQVENLGSVLAADPLRAVQALPGVTSNDDFEARFSLRGEEFSRIGIYLDGVLLHDAVHTLEGTDLSGSASLFNSALVGGLELYEDTRPAALGGSSGAVLEVHMRDGDRDRYAYQFTANLASAGFSAGGPLGRLNACSWISGFRKSYLQYLLVKTLTDPSMAFGIMDGQGRLNCQVTSKNALALDLVDSYTDLNRTSVRTTIGANSPMLIGQHATATNLSWTYSPSGKTVVTSHAAWMDDKFTAQNPAYEPLGHGSYGEWVGSSNVTRALNSQDSFSVGGTVRIMHDSGFIQTFDRVRYIQTFDRYNGSDVLTSGYFDNSWGAMRNHLRLTTGVRCEHDSTDRVSTCSPQAGLAWTITESLQMRAGWGQYVQYPPVSILGSNLGRPALLPLRSAQASVSLEQRLLPGASLRVEFYNRQDRDLLFQPHADPRIIGHTVFMPPVNPTFQNSLRGYGRGVEVTAQRNLGSGITGWLSYSYGRSRMRDGITENAFVSDYDQRHTTNAYASYPIRHSVSLSARWTYGSGFPIPGFLTALGPVAEERFKLAEQRNAARIGPYERLDVRLNKTWWRERRKIVLYTEVTNLTNKANYRFGSLDAYNKINGDAYVTVDQMFPILPSVGVLVAW